MNPSERSILLPLRAIPGSLFSFEALLILFMFAGLYKGDPRFAWIPVDPTALFFALSVVVGSFIVVRNPISKRAFPVIFAMLVFVVWWAVTLTWSPSKVYGPSKVFLMATLVLWSLTAGALIVGPNPERVRRLFTVILLFAIWVGIEGLVIYGEDMDGLMASRRSGEYQPMGTYAHIGRVSGLGALVAFTAWLFGRRTRFGSIPLLALFVALAFVVAIAGGKGPLLATLVPLLLPLLLGLQMTRSKIFYRRYQVSIIALATALTAGLSIYIATTEHVPLSFQRLQNMVVGGDLRGTAADRASQYQQAFEIWPEAPHVGGGAGSWPMLTNGVDWPDYPHNILLETLVETGLVGLFLLVALLVVALRPISMDHLRDDPLALCAFVMVVNTFLNAMVTGDVPDNRTLFMLLGVLTLFTVSERAPSRAVQPAFVRPLAEQSRGRMAS